MSVAGCGPDSVQTRRRTATPSPGAALNERDDDPRLPGYLTLAGPGEAEIKVQRSRFVAYAAPVVDATSAQAFIATITRKHHDARHVCTAWRLDPREPSETRNDDGEPTGSAGEPILNALRSAELVDVVVAVVRYFGGVKLGTGGLGRAYREAAASALEAAPQRRILLGSEVSLEFGYEMIGPLTHLLEQYGGRLADSSFAGTVRWRAWLPSGSEQDFVGAVGELTHGRVRPTLP